MKKILFVLCLFSAHAAIFAQDYLSGKISDTKAGITNVFYDRTQLPLGSQVHQTEYKVLDTNKKALYTIYVIHDKEKATVSISVNVAGSGTESKSVRVNYDRQKCGLIFTDAGNLDTVFPSTKPYAYIFSFTDTSRDFPILHKFKISEQTTIDLDPLTKLRIRKHNELVQKNITKAQVNAVAKEDVAKDNSLVYSLLNDTFNNQLFALRDSLYSKNERYIDIITKMKAAIENDLPGYMKDAHIYNEVERYGGQERNGQPDGKGVLVSAGNIYYGQFANGIFITGQSVIKTKSTVYYGESKSDTMNGKGWLKYTNGSFLLGEFRNERLAEGITLSKDKGEVFFGNLKNNQRTGYGELRNTRGDSFYGEFLNGRLVKGYSKEVDQFGYSTYSRIQNGSKATVPAQLAEIFFDKIHIIKEKAENQP